MQPWRPTSLLGQGWAAALLGTTQKQLHVICRKAGADNSRILRNLKKCAAKNFKWKLEESKGGGVKVYSVKYVTSPKQAKHKKKK